MRLRALAIGAGEAVAAAEIIAGAVRRWLRREQRRRRREQNEREGASLAVEGLS